MNKHENSSVSHHNSTPHPNSAGDDSPPATRNFPAVNCSIQLVTEIDVSIATTTATTKTTTTTTDIHSHPTICPCYPAFKTASLLSATVGCLGAETQNIVIFILSYLQIYREPPQHSQPPVAILTIGYPQTLRKATVMSPDNIQCAVELARSMVMSPAYENHIS